MNEKSKFKNKLVEILKKEDRFVDKEGDLIKSEIINSATSINKDLISLLIKDKEIRNTFFEKIEAYWIFNINKFVEYIQDKNVFSNSVTKFESKIGLTVDGKYLNERGEVSLVWPFKDCILEGGMDREDQKRNEIFFNEVLAKDEIDRLFDPKALTNFKKYTAKGEEKVKDFNRDENGTIKDNLIIKGNNLLALHSLKKEFAGKVKLIYIDPPYNTGGSSETFTYNNTFNHSTWLTFMKNRLEMARELLKKEGFIAITIDHNELFYLGTLSDEIFGRENRIGIITIVHKPEGRQNDKFFTATNEFMLVYSKNQSMGSLRKVSIDPKVKETFVECDSKGNFKYKDYLNKDMMDRVSRENKPNNWYPIYVGPDLKSLSLKEVDGWKQIFPITNGGLEKTWIAISETTQKRIEEGELAAIKDYNGKIVIKYKFREQQRLKTHWIDKKYNATASGTNLVKALVGEKSVSYPKSLYSVLDTLKIMTENNDIVLDFFAGSGTTGHATLELNEEDGGNRQFILIEQLEEHICVNCKRISKILKTNHKDKDFIYCELLKYNEEAIDKIQDANDTKQLLKIWEEMCMRYFLNYEVDIKKFNNNKKDFEKLSLKQQKEELTKMLNKNQLYVNFSEMEDTQYKVSKEDKELNKKFYRGL
jgi:adenine-specific DNA-methyltransferase